MITPSEAVGEVSVQDASRQVFLGTVICDIPGTKGQIDCSVRAIIIRFQVLKQPRAAPRLGNNNNNWGVAAHPR